MDEITIGGATQVAELKDGEVSTYQITPEQFSLQRADIKQLVVDGAQQSLAMMKGVLQGDPGPARDIVVLNAGAAIYAADLADNLESGIAKAMEVIDNGAAMDKLDALVALSNSL